jgi:parvulin-like peptidyl-prolyl cis-trans isomerase-like protein
MTAPPAAPQVRRPTSELGADVPVIQVHGLCPATPDKPADPASCKTVLTRDQFDDVLSAVSLSGQAFTAGAIRNVAEVYVQNLILADAAEKMGIEKDPRIQELLRIVRQRTLADAYRTAMEEKYRTPSPEEIEKYYQANLSRFETVKADRLLIPKYDPKSPRNGNADFEAKAAAVAKEIRERAAKGESIDRLQSEAFIKLGIPAPALLPETGLRRRSTFSPEVEKDVFALKPGEVTKVENEPTGYAIYRLQDKGAYTLQQAKGEIVRDIFRQKMEGAVSGVLQSVKTEYNEQYFGPAPSAQPLAKPGEGLPKKPSSRSVVLPPLTGKKPAPKSTPQPK